MTGATLRRGPGDLTGRVAVAGPVSPILDFAPATPDDLAATGASFAVTAGGSAGLSA